MGVYAKKIIKYKILDDEGDVLRTYQAHPLGTQARLLEWTKLLKIITPSAGSMIGGLQAEQEYMSDSSTTIYGAFMALAQEVDPLEMEKLYSLLLGSLMFNNEEIEEWSDHFDEYPEDFLEILVWLVKENFVTFFTRSRIIQPLMKKMSTNILPLAKEKLGKLITSQKTESSEE